MDTMEGNDGSNKVRLSCQWYSWRNLFCAWEIHANLNSWFQQWFDISGFNLAHYTIRPRCRNMASLGAEASQMAVLWSSLGSRPFWKWHVPGNSITPGWTCPRQCSVTDQLCVVCRWQFSDHRTFHEKALNVIQIGLFSRYIFQDILKGKRPIWNRLACHWIVRRGLWSHKSLGVPH